MKIFVDTDSDIRLVRRLRRDISERGRDIEGVIKQYNKFVKPAFDQYIQPTMRVADIVVPRGELLAPGRGAGRDQAWVPGHHLSCPREREHGGHRPDRSTCAQPTGGGESSLNLSLVLWLQALSSGYQPQGPPCRAARGEVVGMSLPREPAVPSGYLPSSN